MLNIKLLYIGLFLVSGDFYKNCVLCISQEAEVQDVGTLVFTNILYRHGDRTPVDPYPNDPYRNLSYWPVDWGQLTNVGKQQQLKLGQWLRQRYADFLPEKYSHKDIYVRSTDVDRTLMSAESNLAGLYPPVGDQRWDPQIQWQPIPIHTIPEALDELLAAKKPCPRYERELLQVKNSPEMKDLNKVNADLYAYLTRYSGRNVHDVEGVEYIYNTLFIENLFNFTLPDWTKKVFPDKLKPLASYSFIVPSLTKELQRLKAGPLLGEMVSHMKHKRTGTMTPERKAVMYSAHDTTVASFLMTLGVFEAQCPPYTALVLVELRKNKLEEHQVTVFYKNSTTHEPYLLTIPGCLPVCPLDRFIELTRPVIPHNWEQECLDHTLLSEDFALNSLALIAVLVSAVLAILLLVSMLVGILYWRNQKSSTYWYHRVHQDAQ